MRSDLLLAGLSVILGGVLAHECFPREVKQEIPVPSIVTVHDTVHDTIRIRPPKLPPAPNLVLRVTFHTPVQIPVNVVAAERPNLWPILNLRIGASRGDTSLMTTYSLRSGQIAESRIWTPGPLRGAWADSTMTPKLDFGAACSDRGTGLWTKVKWTAVGYLGRTIQYEIQH